MESYLLNSSFLSNSIGGSVLKDEKNSEGLVVNDDNWKNALSVTQLHKDYKDMQDTFEELQEEVKSLRQSLFVKEKMCKDKDVIIQEMINTSLYVFKKEEDEDNNIEKTNTNLPHSINNKELHQIQSENTNLLNDVKSLCLDKKELVEKLLHEKALNLEYSSLLLEHSSAFQELYQEKV